MKMFLIEPFNVLVKVYSAHEFARFAKDSNADADENNHGLVCENHVWIGSADPSVCTHEAVHLSDWVIGQHLGMDMVSLENSTELRAYMVEYLSNKIFACLEKEA